jgi:hypothetical protein
LSEPQKDKPKRGPRKDRGTRRVSLPVAIVEDLDRRFPGAVTTPEAVGWIIEERDKAVALAEGAVTLPPAVQARLAPAAEGSGRSVSDLLLMLEEPLSALLDGELAYLSAGAEPPPPGLVVPSLEERLVADFRSKLRAAWPAEPRQEDVSGPPPSAQVVDLMGALKTSLAWEKP